MVRALHAAVIHAAHEWVRNKRCLAGLGAPDPGL